MLTNDTKVGSTQAHRAHGARGAAPEPLADQGRRRGLLLLLSLLLLLYLLVVMIIMISLYSYYYY